MANQKKGKGHIRHIEHGIHLLDDDEHTYSKTRVESITDSLFATVMTILVLGLAVPIITGPSISGQLTAYIWSIFPNIVGYVITFMILGVLWVGNNNILRYVHSINRRFLWITVIFLLGIGITPFTTSFLGRYALDQPALTLYGINFLFISIMFNIMGVYAMRDHWKAHKGNVMVEAISKVLRTNFIGPLTYAVAIVASFINPYLSLGLFAIVPLYYIVTGLTR